MNTPSPKPWRVVPAEGQIVAHIVASEDIVVAIVPRTVDDMDGERARANAELIVSAVNGSASR